MLAFALRRAIWAVPTLFGVSLVVFMLTTLLPEPDIGDGPLDVSARVEIDELRRARFLDLPRHGFGQDRREDADGRGF